MRFLSLARCRGVERKGTASGVPDGRRRCLVFERGSEVAGREKEEEKAEEVES